MGSGGCEVGGVGLLGRVRSLVAANGVRAPSDEWLGGALGAAVGVALGVVCEAGVGRARLRLSSSAGALTPFARLAVGGAGLRVPGAGFGSKLNAVAPKGASPATLKVMMATVPAPLPKSAVGLA